MKTVNLKRLDEFIELDDEPDHDELCRREQLFFLQGILGKRNLSEHQESAIRQVKLYWLPIIRFETGK